MRCFLLPVIETAGWIIDLGTEDGGEIGAQSTPEDIVKAVALGIFWLQDNDAVKVRFDAAKDLLTIVIGVLGTIMGFYFGSATTGTANLALINTRSRR